MGHLIEVESSVSPISCIAKVWTISQKIMSTLVLSMASSVSLSNSWRRHESKLYGAGGFSLDVMFLLCSTVLLTLFVFSSISFYISVYQFYQLFPE